MMGITVLPRPNPNDTPPEGEGASEPLKQDKPPLTPEEAAAHKQLMHQKEQQIHQAEAAAEASEPPADEVLDQEMEQVMSPAPSPEKVDMRQRVLAYFEANPEHFSHYSNEARMLATDMVEELVEKKGWEKVTKNPQFLSEKFLIPRIEKKLERDINEEKKDLATNKNISAQGRVEKVAAIREKHPDIKSLEILNQMIADKDFFDGLEKKHQQDIMDFKALLEMDLGDRQEKDAPIIERAVTQGLESGQGITYVAASIVEQGASEETIVQIEKQFDITIERPKPIVTGSDLKEVADQQREQAEEIQEKTAKTEKALKKTDKKLQEVDDQIDDYESRKAAGQELSPREEEKLRKLQEEKEKLEQEKKALEEQKQALDNAREQLMVNPEGEAELPFRQWRVTFKKEGLFTREIEVHFKHFTGTYDVGLLKRGDRLRQEIHAAALYDAMMDTTKPRLAWAILGRSMEDGRLHGSKIQKPESVLRELGMFHESSGEFIDPVETAQLMQAFNCLVSADSDKTAVEDLQGLGLADNKGNFNPNSENWQKTLQYMKSHIDRGMVGNLKDRETGYNDLQAYLQGENPELTERIETDRAIEMANE